MNQPRPDRTASPRNQQRPRHPRRNEILAMLADARLRIDRINGASA